MLDDTSYQNFSRTKFIDSIIDKLSKLNPQNENEFSQTISLLSSIDYSYASYEQLDELAKYDPDHLFFDLHNYLQIRESEDRLRQRQLYLHKEKLEQVNATIENDIEQKQNLLNKFLESIEQKRRKIKELRGNIDTNELENNQSLQNKLKNDIKEHNQQYQEIKQTKQKYRELVNDQEALNEKYDKLKEEYDGLVEELRNAGFTRPISERNLEEFLQKQEH